MNRKIVNASKQIERILQFISQHFDINPTKEYERVKYYDDMMHKTEQKIAEYQKNYYNYEVSRNQFPRRLLNELNIDVVDYIMKSQNVSTTCESFFNSGVITPDEYDQIRSYLWKNRPSQKYKLQQNHIPNE